ncbi:MULTISPECIES: cation:proton antiporter [unclassified Cupriavidus]|uniref:cation:proton antiporter n=1 Tax=unclassified Cupriavidus TaxID=2640874 RepID=UPI003F8FC831
MLGTWAWVIGALLITMGLIGSMMKRLPVSASALYLVSGIALGPSGMGLIRADLADRGHAVVLETITEIALLVSLFAVGLRLRVHPRERIWRIPLRLATLGMLLTIAMLYAIGTLLMGLPAGVALLLAAILAPTDPVLASDVQVADPQDRDRMRFSLSGEGGLNDGAAFPFVMLALGLMGARGAGGTWQHWLWAELLWATLAGLALGWGMGWLCSRAVLALRKRHGGALGMESFFTIGLIGTAYGAALAAHSYGFLAVFAAGLAMRHVEHAENVDTEPSEVLESAALVGQESTAVQHDKAAAYLAHIVGEFSLDLERLAELSVMVLVGALLSARLLRWEYLGLGLALILLVRPLAVYLSTAGAALQPAQRRLVAWFGVRGIGSVYYLAYALAHGADPRHALLLADATLCVVVLSVALHGSSATPLMAMYRRWRGGGGG